jgi:hypothetical protein
MSAVNPPGWAEALLRAVLPFANEESVSGDLLEQYRDSVLPSRGRVAADYWYVKQVAGFLWRLCALFVALRVAAVFGRDVIDAVWPPRYWAVAHAYQARSAFTTYAAVLTYLAAGLFGAYRTERVTTGVVVSLATALLTYPITLVLDIVLYLAFIRLDPVRLKIFEATGGWDEVVGLSLMLLPVIAAIAAIGGFAGKYARALTRPPMAT